MRRLGGVALVVAVACGAGCSSGSSSSSPDVTVPVLAADEVLIQLGSYEIGGVPDEFVVGPEIVVYGDGTVYSELYLGGVSFRLVTGQLSETQLQDVFEAAASLPAPPMVGYLPVDFVPVVLRVGSQEWAIDPAAEPFRTFVDEVRSLVDEEVTQPWEPERWIVQPFGEACEVVAVNPDAGPYDAPVYPDALADFPLGAC